MKSRYTKLKYNLPIISHLSIRDWLIFYGKTHLCMCYQKYIVNELIDSNAFFLILELLDGLLVNTDISEQIEHKVFTKILPDSYTLEIVSSLSTYTIPTKLIMLQFKHNQKNHIVYLKVEYSNIIIYTKHIDNLYDYISYT